MTQRLRVAALVVSVAALPACTTERTEEVASSESQFKAVPPQEGPGVDALPINDDWYEPYQPFDDYRIDEPGGFMLGGLASAPPCQSSIEGPIRTGASSMERCQFNLRGQVARTCGRGDYSNYYHTDGHYYSCTTYYSAMGLVEFLAQEKCTPEDGCTPWYECWTDVSCKREGARMD